MNQPQPVKQIPIPMQSRMRLDKLVKGKIAQHVRAVVYGPEGVGKSTFGAGAPNPIFLGAEEGTAQLDVQRFPKPESWTDVLEAIRVLRQEDHDFRTLVVDTLDWIEPIIWSHICARDEKANIEDYGYGKGYQAALDEWRKFLFGLDELRKAKPMHIILLAHAWIRPFKNPAGEDYDRYELKINAKAAGLVKEWVDAVLFTNWETWAKKDDRKRVRGVSSGARIIYTERRAAYDAKNRYSLPEELPLSWPSFESAVSAGHVAEPSDLRAEVTRKAKQLGGDLEKQTLDALERAGTDAQKLAILNNLVNAKLAERADAATTTDTKN